MKESVNRRKQIKHPQALQQGLQVDAARSPQRPSFRFRIAICNDALAASRSDTPALRSFILRKLRSTTSIARYRKVRSLARVWSQLYDASRQGLQRRKPTVGYQRRSADRSPTRRRPCRLATQFPDQDRRDLHALPDFDQYAGPPIEFGRMEPTASDPTCLSAVRHDRRDAERRQ